jgi:hypothetical protein
MLTGTCRRKEPEIYGQGCLADVSQYVETVVPEICFLSRRAIFYAISVGRSSSVSCDEGLCDVSHYKCYACVPCIICGEVLRVVVV